MPKGNATAQAYRVELIAGKPAFIYKGLTASSQIVKANASAVNSVLNGFSIHINVNDKNNFDKAWNEACKVENQTPSADNAVK